MKRWHKKVVGTSLFLLGVLVVIGAGGTMMLEASTGYTGSQTGFGQTLLAIAVGSGSMIVGAKLRSATRRSRRTHYLGLGGLSRSR